MRTFQTFAPKFQHVFVVDSFEELSEMKIRSKNGGELPTAEHIASHVATIFCNHLANLLQKIVASQKTQHTASQKKRLL
jgi:hypothetical protein